MGMERRDRDGVAGRNEGESEERKVATEQDRRRQQDEAKANRRKAGVQGKRWCGRTWRDRMGDGAAGREMMWQNETKVRAKKGRWRQNKTGDGNRTKQKQIGERRVCRAKDGAAGHGGQDGNGVSGQDKKRTPGKGCAGVRN